MSELILASIDLTKINKEHIEKVNKDGEPFKNGSQYLRVAIWVNDEEDKYGNNVSIKAGPKDESYYIGNGKTWNNERTAQPQTKTFPTAAEADADGDGLPF